MATPASVKFGQLFHTMFPRVAMSIVSETSRAAAQSPCAEVSVQGSSWVVQLCVPVELEPH